MKQDDFDAVVRKYTEELMRYNAKRVKTEPASKPPAAEKATAEEKPAVTVQPEPAVEKAVMAEPAEKQEIIFTPSVESVVEEQEEEAEEQQAEEQQESVITERPDPTDEQLEEFAAEQSQQEEPPEETAPEQAEAVDEAPEESAEPSDPAPEKQLPPTADEFVEQNTEPETVNPEESAEDNPPPLEADENFEEIAPEEFIDIPEEKKLEELYKGRGVLKVTAITADGTMPLENAVIKISYESENGEELYAVARTGISGQIEPVALPAPVSDQNAKDVLFAPYTITAQLSGYTGVSITNVPIFDGQITSQTFNLAPLPLGTESGNMDIVSEEPKF